MLRSRLDSITASIELACTTSPRSTATRSSTPSTGALTVTISRGCIRQSSSAACARAAPPAIGEPATSTPHPTHVIVRHVVLIARSSSPTRGVARTRHRCLWGAGRSFLPSRERQGGLQMLVQTQQIGPHAGVETLGAALRAPEDPARHPGRHVAVPWRRPPREAGPPSAIAGDELVLERRDHLETPGITLAPAAAEELPIDASGLVKFRGNHVQPPALGDTRRELDVGATARHVRGHGDAVGLAGHGRGLGLALVVAGVEHAMLEPDGVEQLAH